MIDGAHRVARGFDGGEDLAIDRKGAEPHGEKAESFIGLNDDAERLAVDFFGNRP